MNTHTAHRSNYAHTGRLWCPKPLRGQHKMLRIYRAHTRENGTILPHPSAPVNKKITKKFRHTENPNISRVFMFFTPLPFVRNMTDFSLVFHLVSTIFSHCSEYSIDATIPLLTCPPSRHHLTAWLTIVSSTATCSTNHNPSAPVNVLSSKSSKASSNDLKKRLGIMPKKQPPRKMRVNPARPRVKCEPQKRQKRRTEKCLQK